MKFVVSYFIVISSFVYLTSCSTPKQENNETQVENKEQSTEAEVKTEVSEDIVQSNDSVKVHDITEGKKEDKKEKTKEKVEEKEKEIPETDTYNEKLDPSPNEFVQVDTEAKPKNLEVVKKAISDKVKSLGLSGDCSVGILVSTHGNYLKHYIFGTTHKKIELAVAENIVNLKFTPAKNKGEAVKMWYKIKFKF